MSSVDSARRKADKAQKAAGRAGRSARRTAAKSVAPKLETARDSAVSYAGDAAEWAQPHYETAREKVKDDLAPKVGEAVTNALQASEPMREEAVARATAALAAIRGEVSPPKRKRRWGKRLFLLAALGGAAVAAAQAWSKMNEQNRPSTVGQEESALAGSEFPDGAPTAGLQPPPAGTAEDDTLKTP